MRMYVGDEDRRVNGIITAFTMEHIDWLFRRVQRMDEEGFAIQDLGVDALNPFKECHRRPD